MTDIAKNIVKTKKEVKEERERRAVVRNNNNQNRIITMKTNNKRNNNKKLNNDNANLHQTTINFPEKLKKIDENIAEEAKNNSKKDIVIKNKLIKNAPKKVRAKKQIKTT